MNNPFYMDHGTSRGSKVLHVIALVLGVLVAAATLSETAQAGTKLTVVADRAKVIRFVGEAQSVIVGNPAFADVSVQNGFMIIHGRNFGQTNVLILDERGNQLADLEVTVIKGPDRNISVYRGGNKASYACAPKCESTLQVGDSAKYFKSVNDAISTKMGLAKSAGKLTTK